MKTNTHLTRCAGAAIAAVLAFGPTPILAQGVPAGEVSPSAAASNPAAPAANAPAAVSTTPTMVPPVSAQTGAASVTPAVPPSTPPAANTISTTSPAPTIVLPPETTGSSPAAAPTGPVVQQLPPEPEVLEAEVVEERARVVTEPAPARAPAASPVVSAPQAPEPTVVDAAPVEEAAPIDEAIAGLDSEAPLAADEAGAIEAAPVAATESAQTDETAQNLGWIAAVLAALGLGGMALLGLRRRSGKPRKAPALEARSAPDVVRTPAPVAQTSVSPMPARTMSATRAMDSRASISNDGAAVALPRSLPDSFDERDALLRRMVAARPDRANPFRSPRARTRRARLILQSLGRKFDREPLIDLSQYPGNWPELARRDYATAA